KSRSNAAVLSQSCLRQSFPPDLNRTGKEELNKTGNASEGSPLLEVLKGKSCAKCVKFCYSMLVGLRRSLAKIGGGAERQENGAKLPVKAHTGWSAQNAPPVRALLTFDGASTPLILARLRLRPTS